MRHGETSAGIRKSLSLAREADAGEVQFFRAWRSPRQLQRKIAIARSPPLGNTCALPWKGP
ncbi:hypothetical protein PCL1606_45880 [Pseudomonas chlororaphis]|uniref:Uncharacterized protein n=1 Tax=Pseudomonas chlororaphis TaxID=587753 RepID=A0A0D5Y3Z5_9PSED|nr:hypothetical protein PCL1606_45880 [Pseudomonas chlororaphis]